MIISLIAAMDKNHLIGTDNGLPWHLPRDFKHFKEVTMGKPVVMGRKTYESIGKPLPGRLNIVVSRSGFCAEGVTSVNSVEAAIQAAGEVDELMIMGGASIYQQTIELAQRLYLTHVDAQCEGDAWFPEIDAKVWAMTHEQRIEADDKNNYAFKIVRYERKSA